MIIQYLIVKYEKISPRQLIDLKQNTKSMQYNPHALIDTVFNQVKDIIEYKVWLDPHTPRSIQTVLSTQL